MNIADILNNKVEDMLFKILPPHKRTIFYYKDFRVHKKIIQFDYPLIMIVNIDRISEGYIVKAFYACQEIQGEYYDISDVITEICLSGEFYSRIFQNKDECLQAAIDKFFNSAFKPFQITKLNSERTHAWIGYPHYYQFP